MTGREREPRVQGPGDPGGGASLPVLAGWFALALATRLAFLFAYPESGWSHSLQYEGDATTWVLWARALADGRPFDFDLPIWPPGVAWVLAWIGAGAEGASLVPAKVLWCVVSAASVPALHAVVRGPLGVRVASVAAGLAAFSFGSYVTATSLNSEGWYPLLVVLAVGGTQRLVARPRLPLAALVGVLHGVALLFRPEHLLVLAAFVAWLAASRSGGGRREGRRVLAAAVCGLLALLACVPWSARGARAVERFNTVAAAEPDFDRFAPPWREDARAAIRDLPAFARDGNARFFAALARAEGLGEVTRADVLRWFDERFGYVPRPLGRWTLVSMNGPLDFALANHPGGDGGFSRAGLVDAQGPSDEFSFGRPSHLRLFQEGYAVGLESIARDPSGWLGLVGRKLAIFAGGATLGVTGWNLPYGRGGLRRRVDLVVPTGGPALAVRLLLGAVLAVGAVIGLRRPGARPWLAIVAAKLVVAVFFYGYARQAASILPAFHVLAALAIVAGLDAVERRRGLPLAPRKLGLALLFALAAADAAHLAVDTRWDVAFVDAEGGALPSDAFGPGVFLTNDAIRIAPAGG